MNGWVFGVDVLPSEVQSIEYATSNVDSVMMGKVGMIQQIKNSKHETNITEMLQHKSSLTWK